MVPKTFLWILAFLGLLFPQVSNAALLTILVLAFFNPEDAYLALVAALPLRFVGYVFTPQFSLPLVLTVIALFHLIFESRISGWDSFSFEKPLWIFLGVAVLSGFQSYAIPLGAPIIENAWHNIPWIKSVSRLFLLFILASLVYITSHRIKTSVCLRKVVVVLAWSSLFVAVYSLGSLVAFSWGLQAHVGDWSPFYSDNIAHERLRGFEDEPLFYANYLLVVLGVLGGAFFSKEFKSLRFLLGISWCVNLLALLYTFSRGGIGAFGVGVSLALLLNARKFKRFLKNPFFWAVVALLLFGALQVPAVERILSSLTAVFNPDSAVYTSGSTRIDMVRWALLAWLQHPLLGVGYENYNFYSGFEFYDGVAMYPINWPEVNNLYVKILAEMGVLGALAGLLLLFTILYHAGCALRNHSYLGLKMGLLASFAAIGVQFLFFSTLSRPHVWFLLGLIAVLSREIPATRSNSEVSVW